MSDTLPETNIAPEINSMVGRFISFWDGPFSELLLLVSGYIGVALPSQ